MSKPKNPKKKLEDECDAMMTPLAKKMRPRCEGCGVPTQVGHHWIEKSRSHLLRHDPENIVSLCHSCHAKIHNTFGNSVMNVLGVAERIIKQRGKAWKTRLDKLQPKTIQYNITWLEAAKVRLTKLLHE